MDICEGIVHLESTGEFIGGVSLATENSIDELLSNPPPLAKHVIVYFFVSVDGSITAPIGYFPTVGISTSEAVEHCHKAILLFAGDDLSSPKVRIKFGSSDGFSGAKAFVQQMAELHPNYQHIFNYVHTTKGCQNKAKDWRFAS